MTHHVTHHFMRHAVRHAAYHAPRRIPAPRYDARVVAARHKQADIQRKLAAVRRKVAILSRQEQVHAQTLTALQQTVAQTTVQLEDSNFRLTQAQQQLELTRDQLQQVRSRYVKERELAAKRLRAMYEASTTTEWAALLTSPNLVDFLTRYQYFKHISQADQRILTDLAGMMGDIQHKKHRINDLVSKTEQYTQSIQAQQQTEEQAKEQEAQILKRIRAQKQEADDEDLDLERNSRQIEEMIRRFLAQTPFHPHMGNVRFIFPLLDDPMHITSPFGMRYHPVFHRWLMHTGVDLRAPMHTEILAAASGLVLLAGWYGGYGKCIIIVHGGGYETLYAHCSEWLVHQGEHVRQGQEIALSGMTGDATGPHLHFEVRKDGKPVNPVPYLMPLRYWQ